MLCCRCCFAVLCSAVDAGCCCRGCCAVDAASLCCAVLCSAVDNVWHAAVQHKDWILRLVEATVTLPWVASFEHATLAAGDDPDFDSSNRNVMTCAPDSALVGRYVLGIVGVSTLDPWEKLEPTTPLEQPRQLAGMRAALIHYCVGHRLLGTW